VVFVFHALFLVKRGKKGRSTRGGQVVEAQLRLEVIVSIEHRPTIITIITIIIRNTSANLGRYHAAYG